MKRILFSALTALLLLAGMTSCSSSDDNGGGNATNYSAIAAKYNISGSSNYKSIELTNQGQYIIVKNSGSVSSKAAPGSTLTATAEAATVATSETVLTGTYYATGNNTYALNDFGTIKINSSSDGSSVTSIEVTATGSNTETVNATKAETLPATTETNKLCRAWDVRIVQQVKVLNGKEMVTASYNAETGAITGSALQGETPRQIIFTKTGTYYSVRTSASDNNVCRTWSWKTEGSSIFLDNDSTSKMSISYSGDSLKLSFKAYSSGSTIYYWRETFVPAKITVTIPDNSGGSTTNAKTGLLAAMGITTPVKMISCDGSPDTAHFTYTNGNLTTAQWGQPSENQRSYYSKNTITYSPFSLTTETNDAGDKSSQKSGAATFNGSGYLTSLGITVAAEGINYSGKMTCSYTADGHIAEYSSTNFGGTVSYKYTWSGGNLTAATITSRETYDGETEVTTAVYTFNYSSNAPADNGIFYAQTIVSLNDFEGYCDNDENPMFIAGLLGMKPANVPTSYTLTYKCIAGDETVDDETGTMTITTEKDGQNRITKVTEAAKYTSTHSSTPITRYFVSKISY